MGERRAVGGWQRRTRAALRAGSKAALVLAVALPTGLAAQADSPGGPVPPAHLITRRAALLEHLGRGLVLVRAGGREGAVAHAQDSFRQDDEFFYLTGLEEAGATLVGRSDGAGGGGWVLYLQDREPVREAWTGPRLGPGAEAAALTGLADVRSTARLAADLSTWAQAAGPGSAVWLGGELPEDCRPPARACSDSAIGATLSATGGRVAAVGSLLAPLRLVKDEDELRRLRAAADITGAGLRAGMQVAAPGIREYEVQAAIEGEFRRRGAEHVGFPCIIGSGPNSTILHYDRNRRLLGAGDLVVMDVGAEFGYYTADVTRTIPASGRFSERQRAMYELVLGAQRAAIDAVRPGVSPRDVEVAARAYMRAHSGSLCGASPCDRYFIHGLSHSIGLSVHETGPMPATLAPGMVITIEPGIYIPDEQLGIRIEDDVLVTANGREVLTAAAPKELTEIETLMAARISGPVPGR